MTDEPRTPRRWAGLCTTSFSSTMSTMRSTIKPTLRPASEYTTTCMRASPGELDRRYGELFRPRHQRRWDGHAALLAALHQQKGLVVRRRFLFPAGLVFLLERGLAGLANHLGALRQTQDVQNEGHSSVAHDGCAGVSADPLQLFAQRLDDDLLGIGDLIDHQAKLAAVVLHHHDVRGGVPGCLLPGLGYDLQFAVEIDQRQQASP